MSDEDNTACNEFRRATAVSIEQARAIFGSQASRAARLAAADDVLLNSGTVAELRQAVDRLHEEYLTAGASQRHRREI